MCSRNARTYFHALSGETGFWIQEFEKTNAYPSGVPPPTRFPGHFIFSASLYAAYKCLMAISSRPLSEHSSFDSVIWFPSIVYAFIRAGFVAVVGKNFVKIAFMVLPFPESNYRLFALFLEPSRVEALPIALEYSIPLFPIRPREPDPTGFESPKTIGVPSSHIAMGRFPRAYPI